MDFNIGKVQISRNGCPVVIPEIGINHNGDLKVAMKMVDEAHKAGAKWIKHQTHIISDEMSQAACNVIPGNSTKSIYTVMEECALSERDEQELKVYTESKGMEFLSTPFSRAAADRLEKLGVKGYKIGSGELNNYPLIKHIAEFGKPMIVSTGMNNIRSIDKAVEILESYHVPYALLHTTNIYPTRPDQVRLGAMQQMLAYYKEIPIGLSDHTLNNYACISAVALGASIVERHFTDSKQRPGNDIICSMDGDELSQLLQATEEVWQMRGGLKEGLAEEQVTIDFAFATVVSIKAIKAGEKLTKENIWVKRPGTGEIPAAEYESLLGRTANRNIPTDIHLSMDMID